MKHGARLKSRLPFILPEGSKLVHRPHIIRQHQHKHALARRRRAGKDSAPEDLQRGVIGEGEAILSGAKGFGKHFQLFVTADELYGLGLGRAPGDSAQQHEEIGAACFSCFA